MNLIKLFSGRLRPRFIRCNGSIFFFLLLGCTDVIELELPSDPTRLVVDAVITNEPVYQVVRLSKSEPYFSDEPAPVVSKAKVIISDGTTEYVMNESSEHPGHYLLSPRDFRATPNTTYTLSITGVDLHEDGKSGVFTATTTMPALVKVNLLYLLRDEARSQWQVFTWFNDPDEENFYKFRVWLNDELLTLRPATWIIMNDLFFNGKLVQGLLVQSINAGEKGERLKTGDVITLDLCSITASYYRFIDALHRETMFRTPMFGGPPSNVPGNISNGALGFFTAVAISNASLVFDEARHGQ